MPYSSKVCRNLFGPVDHQELQNDLEDLLRQHLEEAQQRWNFNFETETPLEGQFKWERVWLAEQPSQEVHSLVRAPSSESRSSLVHKAPPKDYLGRICPEESQQSSEVHRAGSPLSLKRGQTTIKGECWRLGGIVDVMTFLAGTEGGDLGVRALPGSSACGWHHAACIPLLGKQSLLSGGKRP